jgi:1-acyl-sn-glycerol-3-phosphate acyltransferase
MLRGIWLRAVLIVATVALATPVAVLVLLVPRWGNLLVHAGRLWSKALLAAAGARVTYHGREHAHAHTPCVFIANHQSIVDIWVMLGLVPSNTRFVAKQELFRIPIFGWALATTGCIPVNRANRAEAIRSLGVAAERIRAGRSVVLYPEGTRSRDGSLQPFKKGAFHLALAAGVPVVPVAITGSFGVVPPRTLRVRPGRVDVWIDPPVDVTPFCPANHEGLRDVVQASIERHFRPTAGAAEDRAIAHGGP